jgi:hypothetical protein
MAYLVSGIIILGIITAIMGYAGNRKRQGTKNSETETSSHNANPAAVSEGDCCGRHEICERDRRLTATGRKIEYYDDEELDAFRGKASDRYDEDETESFREVLYTMRETEVADWLCSLQLRGIHLPDQLKDEVLLIMKEQPKKN